jgi:hypothetical protein
MQIALIVIRKSMTKLKSEIRFSVGGLSDELVRIHPLPCAFYTYVRERVLLTQAYVILTLFCLNYLCIFTVL